LRIQLHFNLLQGLYGREVKAGPLRSLAEADAR
jgi:hypothetical protein